jgi:hypothetical protein
MHSCFLFPHACQLFLISVPLTEIKHMQFLNKQVDYILNFCLTFDVVGFGPLLV